ncbi:MAG: hypothetical protein VX899_08810 [Myxococcota bacterium]|nr:hypothetical protein [Myxococcota bacterium]
MTTTASGMPFPWTLRLSHHGYAGVHVEWSGRRFLFDPAQAPTEEDQVILTWHVPERLKGTLKALRGGTRLRVMADESLSGWLQQQGQGDFRPLGGQVDKQVSVEALDYTPRTPDEVWVKAVAALRKPSSAARKLLKRDKPPASRPQVVQLTFPNGKRLLHLGLALHRGTDAEWLRGAQERFVGADWVIVGMEPGEEEAAASMVAGFGADQILVTDLVNEVRADLGLPTNVLTLTVDRMLDEGLAAYPFVSGAGYRYE